MQTVNGLQPPLPLLLYLPPPTLCNLKRFHSPVPAYCCHVSPAAVSADCSWWTITKSGHQDIRESGTCMLCSAEACDADSQCVPCGRDARIAHHLQREREREREVWVWCMPKSDRDKCRLCMNTSVCVWVYLCVCMCKCVCLYMCVYCEDSTVNSRRFSAFFNML